MGELREVHIRISAVCFRKLKSIAEEDEMPIATVCRQALWQFVRIRLPDDRAEPQRPSRKVC